MVEVDLVYLRRLGEGVLVVLLLHRIYNSFQSEPVYNTWMLSNPYLWSYWFVLAFAVLSEREVKFDEVVSRIGVVSSSGPSLDSIPLYWYWELLKA